LVICEALSMIRDRALARLEADSCAYTMNKEMYYSL